MAGYELGDATWATAPITPYAESFKQHPGSLRIAMSAMNVLGAETDAESFGAMEEAAKKLEELGHHVSIKDPELPGPDTLWAFTQVFTAMVGMGIRLGETVAKHSPTAEEIEPLSQAVNDIAKNTNAIEYSAALAELNTVTRNFLTSFNEFDLILTPALAERPLQIGELTGCGEEPMMDFARSGAFTPFTGIANITGQPAISVPIRLGDDGIPTGIQLIGKPLAEDTLLQVAAQLEQVTNPLGRPVNLA
jgi:amidase